MAQRVTEEQARALEGALAGIARLLADNPEQISINCERTAHLAYVTATCHPADKAVLIGQGGKTIKALRLLTFLYSRRIGVSMIFQVESL